MLEFVFYHGGRGQTISSDKKLAMVDLIPHFTIAAMRSLHLNKSIVLNLEGGTEPPLRPA